MAYGSDDDADDGYYDPSQMIDDGAENDDGETSGEASEGDHDLPNEIDQHEQVAVDVAIEVRLTAIDSCDEVIGLCDEAMCSYDEVIGLCDEENDHREHDGGGGDHDADEVNAL
jgi:hypothetical protein